MGCSAGDVVGIVFGVLAPLAGLFTWLSLTRSYRQFKRSIVLEVVRQIRVTDIAVASQQDDARGKVPSLNIMKICDNGVRDDAHLQIG